MGPGLRDADGTNSYPRAYVITGFVCCYFSGWFLSVGNIGGLLVQLCSLLILQHNWHDAEKSLSYYRKVNQVSKLIGTRVYKAIQWYRPHLTERTLCSSFTEKHYNDVTMNAMASQITSLTIVYSTVYLGADQRKHQSSASQAFVRGIHRCPGNSRTKGQLRRKCFHLMTSSRNQSRHEGKTMQCNYSAIA